MSPAKPSETHRGRLPIPWPGETDPAEGGQIPAVCGVSSLWRPCPTGIVSLRGCEAHFEPESVTVIPGAPVHPREAIFSKSVLKNVAFTCTKIFHSLPA